MRKTVFRALVFHLRIWESDPDFIDLIGTKNLLDPINSGPKKGNIVQPFFRRCFSASPKSSTFYVDAYVVFIRISPT